MDFASLMSKKIAESKARTRQATANQRLNTLASARQRSSVRPKYLSEQKELEEKRAAKAAEKRKREKTLRRGQGQGREAPAARGREPTASREEQEAEEERARRKRLGLPELPPPGANGKTSHLRRSMTPTMTTR